MINEHPRVPAMWMFENYQGAREKNATLREASRVEDAPWRDASSQWTSEWVVESSNFCYEKEPKPALSNRLYTLW